MLLYKQYAVVICSILAHAHFPIPDVRRQSHHGRPLTSLSAHPNTLEPHHPCKFVVKTLSPGSYHATLDTHNTISSLRAHNAGVLRGERALALAHSLHRRVARRLETVVLSSLPWYSFSLSRRCYWCLSLRGLGWCLLRRLRLVHFHIPSSLCTEG